MKISVFDSFKNFMTALSAFGEIVFSLSKSVELLHILSVDSILFLIFLPKLSVLYLVFWF